jgi:PEP-CTERM motif
MCLLGADGERRSHKWSHVGFRRRFGAGGCVDGIRPEATGAMESDFTAKIRCELPHGLPERPGYSTCTPGCALLSSGGTMHHFFRIVAFVGLTCLAVPTPAAADPISITSGSIVVTDLVSIGTISIAGTRGFSIEGSVDPNEGRVDPINACPCLAGTTISLVAVLSGSAVVGTATLDGNQYELTGSIEDPAGVFLELVGTAMLPQLVSSATVVIAPFSVTASSVFVFDGGSVPLNGSGIASLSLSPTFPVPNEPPLWMVDQVRYDFAPVPEPSTMTLITLGLAATMLLARMRRRGTRPEGERRPG